ncbi:hypothetical protein PHLCEN_2v7134 [Hermanssonia centrifuga]|uniref:Uncharacterized protein n=1 Tax=Hermanssonia centrifuga TaxID=98765 RepID=A0A2R6NXI3_9APHY|nr:hypothetical protein PHLCEN_2v7134 [Hermanssonia centrifuga]
MRFSALHLLAFFAVPVTVSACEGDCIVGITNAFISNYTDPVHGVLENIASQISNMLPKHPSSASSLHYLKPITDAYSKDAYDGMETAIFPNYFHGKCQQNGVDPPGCPNPDCPVVCGTPGSLVHFYGKLRYIAFNQTKHILQSLATPGSDTYQQVEQDVLNAANANMKRMSRIYAHANPYGTTPMFLKKREDDIKTNLKRILAKIPSLMERTCGGSGDGETNGLSDCSWEDPMKAYILSFP